MRTASTALLTAVTLTGLIWSAAATAELRIHGAATVARGIVEPNKAAIEGEAGVGLNVVVNGSGNGLQDLVAGRADVAMIAAGLETEAKIINEANPGSLNVEALRVFPVGTSTLRFIVNPANPVKTLTEDQLRDVLSGKIANWKEVGGADSPIQIIIERPGQGSRSSIEAGLLKDRPFAASARAVATLAQVPQIVAQLPNAIGYGNATSIEPDKTRVLEGLSVAQPLALVTKGEPNEEMKKIIAATAKFGTKK